MMHPNDWNGVLETVKNDDHAKMDALVRTEDIIVHEGTLIIPNRSIRPFKSDFLGNGNDLPLPEGSRYLDGDTGENAGVVLTLSQRAITQIATRLSIPARYLKRKFSEKAWKVVDEAIRDDLERQPGRVLLRLKGEMVRAVLSSKYVRLNNYEILEDVAELVKSRTNIKDMWLDVDGLWIKMLFPDLSFTGPDGKEYNVGCMVGNSEVGHRSVTVEPFIYRLSCTNDLVVQQDDRFKQRHIHIDRNQMRYGLRKALAASIQAGDEVVASIEDAMAEAVESPVDVIDALCTKARYSQKFADSVKESYAGEPMENRWGVVNAFTNAAQALEGDKRVDVERFAGSILTAPAVERVKAPVATDTLN